MIKIDDSLLEEIGLLSLPKAERDQLLRQIYETLEMRVGMKLAERMTEQQLDEFERFIDTNDEAGALKWLETNFPDYKQVVASELDTLKEEIKKDAPRLMEAIQANVQTPAAQQPPQFTPSQPSQVPAPQAYQPPQQPFGGGHAAAMQPQSGFAQQPNSQPVAQQQQPQSFSSPDPASPQMQQSAVPGPAAVQSPQQQQSAQTDDQQQASGPSVPPPPSF